MTAFDVSFHIPGEKQDTLLTAGKHFRFDIYRIEEFFFKNLSSPMIDLLRIGMAVYVTDRLVRRKRREQQRHWSRSLALRVGVLEPDLWNNHNIKDSLIECLEFLTDDSWDIDFELDDRRLSRVWQPRLFPFSSETRLCLNSGGLDSAAGLGNQFASDPTRPTIPITVWHQGGQRHIIQRQIDFLRKHCPHSDLNPLVFKAHLLHGSAERRREETTQRSRAFLFMAAGAATASMCACSEIDVYESGIGAINLPLMAGMTGSRTTRSTHPEFLRLMSRLVSTIGNHEMKFKLPYNKMTKGDVVGELARNGLGELAKFTVSCVHYPLREKIGKQCGVCPACLFRRQAMLTAGIEENAETYKYDLFTGHNGTTGTPTKKLSFLKAYLMQMCELQDVQFGEKLPERVLRHLVGTNIVEQSGQTAPYVRLLGRYRDQWMDVARQAESKGYSWTKMLGPVGSKLEGVSRAQA